MKRKVREDRGGGGDSELSNLGAKRRNKRTNERERTTLQISDNLWTRSPSYKGERRPRSPEQGGKRVRWDLGGVG